jgi:hypothetical protein
MCKKEQKLSSNEYYKQIIAGLEGALIRLDGIDDKLSREQRRSANIAYDLGFLSNQVESTTSDRRPRVRMIKPLPVQWFDENEADNEALWFDWL